MFEYRLTLPSSFKALQKAKPINDQYFPSLRNRSTDLHCNSIDWCLYDGENRTLMG